MLRTRLRPAASVVGISGHFSSLSARQLQFGAAATRARAAVSSLGGSARPASAATAQRSFAAAAAAPGKPSRPSKRSAADAAPPAWQSKWEAVIGIEVHAQVISKTKLFSGACVASVRRSVSPTCAAQARRLCIRRPPTRTPRSSTRRCPARCRCARCVLACRYYCSLSSLSIVIRVFSGQQVLNKHCVQQAIRTGLALGGRINLRSWFERKHYFYCDLPQGYQITQQDGAQASCCWDAGLTAQCCCLFQAQSSLAVRWCLRAFRASPRDRPALCASTASNSSRFHEEHARCQLVCST